MTNIPDGEVLDEVLKNESFSYLTKPINAGSETKRSDFSSGTKSEIFISDTLQNALKCKICGGFLHVNAISFDHIKRKQDGGRGTIENTQMTHPYCNTTMKG